MKPLKFKVKRLCEVDTNYDTTGQTYEALGDVLAYQLTPEGDYSAYPNGGFINPFPSSGISYWNGKCFYQNEQSPLQPFPIMAEHYESFKQAVHEYNIKYCDVPDVEVLDGFINDYCKTRSGLQWEYIKRLAEEYKATLCSPDKWFGE